MQLFTFATTAVPSFIQAQLSLEVKTFLFGGLVAAACLLIVYLILLRFPRLRRLVKNGMSKFAASISGKKHEARLNKIVCYHCNKGMGLYNPNYLEIGGQSHIEGTCSHCGQFIRVRLN